MSTSFPQRSRKQRPILKASQSPDARRPYLEQLKTLTIELALAKGQVEQSTANANSASQKLKATQLEITSGSDVQKVTLFANEYLYVDNLTVDMIQKTSPGTPSENISKTLPFLKSALKEFHLSTPELVSATVATIITEVPGFVPISEMESRFNSENAPFDKYEFDKPIGHRLANKEPGDGAKFKGRGFLQITGRANYAQMDELLGLGSRLITSPDDMNDPDVAARALCAFVATRPIQISTASQSGDLASMRTLMGGGTHGVSNFIHTFTAIMFSLSASTKDGAVTANSSAPP